MDTTTRAAANTAGDSPDSNFRRYLNVLRELGTRAFVLNTALLEAHLVDTPAARQHAITALHTRARSVAALANEALADRFDSKEKP